MILAGDIGGTKASLGLFAEEGGKLRATYRARLATRDYPGFEQLVEAFLAAAAAHNGGFQRKTIEAAGFGVAGVVSGGKHYSENLPWVLDTGALSGAMGLRHVCLLNDLAAAALSLERLPAAEDLVVLNAGAAVAKATRGVIAAGTGLGTALLFWNGCGWQVAPSEAGQADFAPRTEQEGEFLSYLRRKLTHVSNEAIVSGRGFRRIHEFLDATVKHDSFEGEDGQAASEITRRASEGSCRICEESVRLWVEIFAGVTGNFALQTMSLGGIFITGGIGAKLLPRLRERSFYERFCGSGKLAQLMKNVPLSVVTDEDAAVLGAAYEALRRARL